MALHETPPIPAELMDEPEGGGEAGRLMAEADQLATNAGVDYPAAVEMLADAETGSWRVSSDDEAEWALRKLADAQQAIAEHQARAEAWARRIAEWFQHATAEERRTVEFFTAHLSLYGRRRRDATGAASLALPSGRVKTRRQAPAIVITDPDAVLAWAREAAPQIIRTREEVLVTALREVAELIDDNSEGDLSAGVKRVAPDGEVTVEPIPGAAVRPEEIGVSIELAR